MAKANSIRRRVERLDSYGCWDFENVRNRELAALQAYLTLLDGPYLTLSGLNRVEEMLGWSEDCIEEVEEQPAEEE
jgi:hypothetical protein